MIRQQLQIIFFTFLLITPFVITTISCFNEDTSSCEIYEPSSEEEQNEERESEEEKEIEGLSEFDLHNQYPSVALHLNNRNCFSEKQNFPSLCKDVLTPPPKFC